MQGQRGGDDAQGLDEHGLPQLEDDALVQGLSPTGALLPPLRMDLVLSLRVDQASARQMVSYDASLSRS